MWLVIDRSGSIHTLPIVVCDLQMCMSSHSVTCDFWLTDVHIYILDHMITGTCAHFDILYWNMWLLAGVHILTYCIGTCDYWQVCTFRHTVLEHVITGRCAHFDILEHVIIGRCAHLYMLEHVIIGRCARLDILEQVIIGRCAWTETALTSTLRLQRSPCWRLRPSSSRSVWAEVHKFMSYSKSHHL
jgi:hypothetical protein